MKAISMALLLSAVLFAGACSDDSAVNVATTEPATTEATSAQAANLTPEELGELGARIEKQPNDAEKILSEKGLDEESFEQAIRKVSEDPQASKRYADSYQRAKA